jgi:hypothetical protein
VIGFIHGRMTMTRKDYIALASAVCKTKPTTGHEVDMLINIINNMSSVFKEDNTNFDEEKYVEYCRNLLGVEL